MTELGFVESTEKAVPPSTEMVFLGIKFNTVDMTLEVTPDRLEAARQESASWLGRSYGTRKQLQSLLGKFLFIAKCVRPARVFLARLLEKLRSLKGKNPRFHIDEQCQKDLIWWHLFLPNFNGVTMLPFIEWSSPDMVIASDACLSGCGAVAFGQYFHTLFPSSIIGWCGGNINVLELVAIVIAIKQWSSMLTNAKLVVNCDNMTVVHAINHGHVYSPCLLTGLRELWYLAGAHNFDIKARHIPGVENRLPDMLSRWHLSPTFGKEFYDYCMQSQLQLQEISIMPDMFDFISRW